LFLNVSYNNKSITREIDETLGKAFTLKERIRMRGIGSSPLVITDASESIQELLDRDSNRNICNIELRPKGIILGFRSLLESYVLLIPYYQLVIYKGTAETYSIYKHTSFVKINATPKDRRVHKFIQKVLREKAKATSSHPVDDRSFSIFDKSSSN
jgi:hypothetical protein